MRYGCDYSCCASQDDMVDKYIDLQVPSKKPWGCYVSGRITWNGTGIISIYDDKEIYVADFYDMRLAKEYCELKNTQQELLKGL